MFQPAFNQPLVELIRLFVVHGVKGIGSIEKAARRFWMFGGAERVSDTTRPLSIATA